MNSRAFIIAYIIALALFGTTIWLFLTYTTPIDISTIWFEFGEFKIPFGVYIDHLSLVMMLIATALGVLDIHFSNAYMSDEPHQIRYYTLMIFFISAMILLVIAKDLVSLFVGWELMGLASYLLISFWHQKRDPADAGMSAFLFTKFGDIFLFASIGLLFYLTGTLDLQELNQQATNGDIEKNIIYIISIFIFISAIGKSGQFPLFPWLMRAMEGPTTVSALIHGATMVNGGIYIIARMFDFYIAGEALIIVALFGAISAFIGATSALVQSELKKVLAYSTMSHLSLAFIGLGAGSFSAGVGHLVNHAVFKALLFLSAGAIIMYASHTKDMFRFGGYYQKMKYTAIFMGLGALSLSGIPPFSGFYSKDMVISASLLNPATYGLISTLTIIAGVLSVAYIGRLWFLSFAGVNRDEKLYQNIKPLSFFWINLPLLIMAIVTLLMGIFHQNILEYLQNSSEVMASASPTLAEVPNLALYLLPIIIFIGYLTYFYYAKRFELTQKIGSQPLMRAIHKVLFNGYFVEYLIFYLSKNIIVNGIAKSINYVDRHIIDKSVLDTVQLSQKIRQTLSKTHTSITGDNSAMMIMGLSILIVIFFVGGVV